MTGRPTALAYGRAGACCAYSRCGMGGLCFIFFFSRLSCLPYLMPHLLGDGALDILKYCGLGRSYPAVVVSYY